MSLFGCTAGRPYAPLSEVNTGDVAYDACIGIDGVQRYEYHPNIAKLISKVLVENCMENLSFRQEKIIAEYIRQAGIVTTKLKEDNADPRNGMTKAMLDLDNFLGGFRGDSNGK